MLKLRYDDQLIASEFTYIPTELLIITIDIWCIKLSFQNKSISLGKPPTVFKLVAIIASTLSFLSSLTVICFFEELKNFQS
jgi:hypothetical protein